MRIVDKQVKLRGGDMSPLTKALFKVIHPPTTRFQLGDLHPSFGHPGQVVPATRITPKLK